MKQDRMVFNLKHRDPNPDVWRKYPYDLNFVFYPKESHMHGFRDEPPKTFEEVYKVYYSWSIEEVTDAHPGEEVIHMRCDECSAVLDLALLIRHCLQNEEDGECLSCGQEGSIWELKYYRKNPPLTYKDNICFSVWSNYTYKGYRFWLDVDEANEFAQFIDDVNNHMLENGEPI
mgnify:CR=1 FL=1